MISVDWHEDTSWMSPELIIDLGECDFLEDEYYDLNEEKWSNITPSGKVPYATAYYLNHRLLKGKEINLFDAAGAHVTFIVNGKKAEGIFILEYLYLLLAKHDFPYYMVRNQQNDVVPSMSPKFQEKPDGSREDILELTYGKN